MSRFLTNKDRLALIEGCFPFTLRFFLLPELNVMTVQLVSESLTSDKLLSNLFMDRDLGHQIRIKET